TVNAGAPTRKPRPAAPGGAIRITSGPSPTQERDRSMRERIGPNLEVHRHRHHALAAFLEPGDAVAARSPQAAAFPASVGVGDAAVAALGVEAGRIRHLEEDHLAVLEGDETILEVGGGHRHVIAEPGGVVLVDPRVVARLRAVLADAIEARA